ncbi:NAD(P)/FAD-dependent oxidoreductase [Paenibacillus sp. YYML68]|uniref:NAD(P)/FAD-dependent oxidoreductase n=1 Tax=Paenibacillus sp. YYML68 TaxID=2909250 RepID=UPI002490870E|nr:NAD(P)/FAD-dependent oxidoreductase [Paenibacillus sp. YYML68]
MSYDVIVVGGGSSGLMAAVAASGQGAKVLLLDKGDKLGRKLGISGGGRCNVTNAKDTDELIKHIPGNGKFLHSALNDFGNRDIMRFFESMGIALKEEDNGRMFPVSNKAKSVVDALVGKVRTQGVHLKVNSPVREVIYRDGAVSGVKLRSGEVIKCRCVIVAVGGKSVPHTGSEGDGYAWAELAGHTITELYPTEVPLTSGEPFIQRKELQGLSLREIRLTVWNAKGKRLVEHQGDMIFTHFGLSGPTALRCSQYVIKALKQVQAGPRTVLLTLDLKPDRSAADVYAQTLLLAKQEARKSIKNVLKSYVPERIIPMLLSAASLSEELTYDHIPKQPWLELAKLIKAYPIRVNGTLSIQEAFVTGGGVNLKEIDPKTMQSKLMHGLFFCGEILDIHGYTGGYNITAAFSTGHSAGKHAAKLALAARSGELE